MEIKEMVVKARKAQEIYEHHFLYFHNFFSL